MPRTCMCVYEIYFHPNENVNTSHTSELILFVLIKQLKYNQYVEAQFIGVTAEKENYHYYQHPAKITHVP